ncbi:MAG TPA: beta-propeller fold lactonase family protein [Candidatus Acidoferrales bacterium]|jgi:6-phosphogluconolactonase|nr:beta-propeller fold lactonase family protein [Candidatus Acidoferrales bacterium]
MGKALRMLLMAGLAIGLASPTLSNAQDADKHSAGAVFVMTNAVDKNEVIAYRRASDGTLQEAGRFSTGGRGSGGNNDPLESQGSLRLSEDHSLLFAVNAGSGSVSVFSVHGSQLSLVDKVISGGSEPNAIALHGNLAYVVNVGGSSNVVGFRLDNGKFRQIPNSTRFLSTNTSGAGGLAFSPDGRFLVVIERLTNDIDVFSVQGDSTLSPIVVNPSAGPGAFSVSFAPNGAALVSETGPSGVTNGSAISSYEIASNGTLSPISTSVPTLGAANCWNVVAPDGSFVYTSNAGSSTISGFAIANTGVLAALPGTVVGTNPEGSGNLDIAVSSDGRFIYTLNSAAGAIGIFSVQKDGTLLNVGFASGVSPLSGFNGIAAF